MIVSSSAVSNNYTVPSPKTNKFTVPLKSRYANDRNEIISVSYRAPLWNSGSILCEEGELVATGAVTSQGTLKRPPLMHSDLNSLNITSGTGYVQATPALGTFYNVILLVKPTSATFRVSTSATTATFTLSGSNYAVSGTGFTAYVNGAAYTSSPFPIQRLIVLSYAAQQTGSVRLGNTYNGSGTIDTFVLGQLGFADAITGTTPRGMNSTEVADFTNLFYRKEDTSLAVTDTTFAETPYVGVGSLSDTLTTLPDAWTVVSSS